MEVFGLMSSTLRDIATRRFEKPTPIQEAVIPKILEGRDALVISETGSGKTEAALLPIFDLFLKGKHKQITILYITPLRSLNRDLQRRIEFWSKELGFEASVRHGDTSQYERGMQVQNPPDMMISTPETLQAMLTGKRMREHLKNIRYIVIDEVHELVDSKRGVQLTVGLERLKHLIGKRPQIVCLSATVGTPKSVGEYFMGHDGGFEIVDTVKRKATKLHVESPKPASEDRTIAADVGVSAETVARIKMIADTIKKRSSVLVFTNTRETSEVLSSRLKALSPLIPIDTHHSSLSKEVRIRTEQEFKEQKTKALVCTSSLELGIDIGSIDFIFQYMSPRQVAKLLQRVGRSGHSLDRVSEGIIIAADVDDCFEAAVIAKLALEGRIEKSYVYPKSLDVLVHQIVGLSLDEYKMPSDTAYKIIKKAKPFENLAKEEFLEAAMFAQKLGLIWVNDRFESEAVLKRKNKSFQYYFGNLSTIPDTKTYSVVDIVRHENLGSLDEEFVAMHGRAGVSFIVKGQPWKILDVTKTKVMVEPLSGLEGAIPAWEGELIPVPFEVAQEVGRLRRKIAEGKDVDILSTSYHLAKEAAEKMAGAVQRQKRYGCVPSDKEILVEYGKEEGGHYVIIHGCFGSLANETLGIAVSSVLIKDFGSIGLKTDPYRIVLKASRPLEPQRVLDILRSYDSSRLAQLLQTDLVNSELFKWRFMHVAKRVGIISKDADFGKGYLRKLIEVYSETPAYKEAMNEVFHEKLDVDAAAGVLGLFREGKFKVTVKEGLSPFGEPAMKRRYEAVATPKPEAEIFEVFKERLLSTNVGLICFHCGKWARIVEARETPELMCLSCKSRLISYVPPRWVEEARELIKKTSAKKKLSEEEQYWLNRLFDSASLIINNGKDAVLCMTGKGVGPKTAARILQKQAKGDELLKEILDAERQYAKTKRFWKG